MKLRFLAAIAGLALAPSLAYSTEADNTTIVIGTKTPGPTSFISQVALTVSDVTVLASIKFSIAPKAGSVTRPFTQTYSASYLTSHGYLQSTTGQIFLPVVGLYSSFTNTVTLTYSFLDGSSKQDVTPITTGGFTDPCGISTPTRLQARTTATSLSYDYIFVRGNCGNGSGDISPVIIDTDGAVRWINPFPGDSILTSGAAFFDHAVYLTKGAVLYRVELDGTVTTIRDYSSRGVMNFHHQIDPGRTGMVLDIDTADFYESLNMEVDTHGHIIKSWSFPDIISAAMTAGGDDPSQFVFNSPDDWWHNNSVTYRKSDNAFIVSAREDFVIGLNYDTDEIKWILGDKTKKWFQFPSLRQFALALGDGSLPPIGQHSVSIAANDDLLLMDNGRNSLFETPMGVNRTYSSPRRYDLALADGVATEVWNFPLNESVYSQFCGSTYEDAPFNYVVDYAFVTTTSPTTARILGLDAAGSRIFDYQYSSGTCTTAYNSVPFHAERLSLSDAGQMLNISTRGAVSGGQNALIAGFIITGSEPKDVVLRALGGSLASAGVSDPLADPALSLFNSAGTLMASNDNWKNDKRATEINAQGLAPKDDHEAALVRTLAPGAYTVAVSGSNNSTGVALVEAYDLSRNSNSSLGNISTRGFVGKGDQFLISGFIVGSRNQETAVIRAIGPSLSSGGVTQPLADPMITLYDSNGAQVATNDNWQDGPSASKLQALGLAPNSPAEAAALVALAPGAYTAVVEGVSGGTGIGLVEVYNLP